MLLFLLHFGQHVHFRPRQLTGSKRFRQLKSIFFDRLLPRHGQTMHNHTRSNSQCACQNITQLLIQIVSKCSVVWWSEKLFRLLNSPFTYTCKQWWLVAKTFLPLSVVLRRRRAIAPVVQSRWFHALHWLSKTVPAPVASRDPLSLARRPHLRPNTREMPSWHKPVPPLSRGRSQRPPMFDWPSQRRLVNPVVAPL